MDQGSETSGPCTTFDVPHSVELAAKWHTIQGWSDALNRFALLWEARFPEQRG